MAATLVVAALLAAALPGSATRDLARAAARGDGDGAAGRRFPHMAATAPLSPPRCRERAPDPCNFWPCSGRNKTPSHR
jgi:hypothetical protein